MVGYRLVEPGWGTDRNRLQKHARVRRDDLLGLLDCLDRHPLKKGNCQLEAAGIAGTRTPSEAASNYQLCWVLPPVFPGCPQRPKAGALRPQPRCITHANRDARYCDYLTSTVAPAASRSFFI